MELTFDGPINKDWNNYAIDDLFHTPVTKTISGYHVPIADNIKQQVRRADVLFIWTDCDREGEAIGGDVADLCRHVKPNIQVWRAHFSSMQPAAIHRAAQNHVPLDMKQVEAVRARSELDLRIGAAFTRLQTIQLRSHFDPADRPVLSYGSCQFPTLGFVVDRYQLVENFIPEDFWKITMTHEQQREGSDNQPIKTTFNWRRKHLFDQWDCFILFEICYNVKIATVTKVQSKQTSKWKPLPLTTVEMQKVACRVLGLSGSHIMTIAEDLYTRGLISYPRTETDQFERGFDFMTLIGHQTQDRNWGEYAQMLRDGEFEQPRFGTNNDKAHPPIHPTAYDVTLTGDHKRVYEFIVRRFLGCCWKNAIGHETTVEVKMDTEFFDAKGLVILEKNYLEVYTYDKWSGNEIPEFHEGDQFVPDSLNMEAGKTTAPKFLTESDLIGLMEKNEIGTDATIAEHIQKVIDRKYVYKEGTYFKPLTLGTALVLGYNQVGLEASLSKPQLRRSMEADLKEICNGNKTFEQVRRNSLAQYREMFDILKVNFSRIEQSMRTNFNMQDDRSHGGSGTSRNHGNGNRGAGRGRGTDSAPTRGRGGTRARARGRGRGQRGRGT
ncbi:DNA topoisomerase [Mucor mucedo]|uniref:DNA topoisomerase n=1 Tax=Mucor mucedo TaxID=29922 RepID=UPI00221FD6C7|nr:DNA topoisomerase [Mucor mucedo]KAI7896848.1 DNA topoisomerase [Mucor mucedo]